MPSEMIVDNLCTKLDTPHKELFFLSEIDFQNFDYLMVCHQIQDKKRCQCCLAEYLNNIASLLLNGFHTESNKMKCLRNAALGKKWELLL